MRTPIIASVALAMAIPLHADELRIPESVAQHEPRILESAAKLAAETQLENPEPERRRPARPVGLWLVGSLIVGGLVAAMILTGADTPTTLQQGEPPPPPLRGF